MQDKGGKEKEKAIHSLKIPSLSKAHVHAHTHTHHTRTNAPLCALIYSNDHDDHIDRERVHTP